MSYNELITIALVIFAVTQVEKSIARRTADEIERRSKPQAALAPKPKPPSATPQQCWAFLVTLGIVAFPVLVFVAIQQAVWPAFFLAVVVALGIVLAVGPFRPIAQGPTGPRARSLAGTPMSRPE